MVSPSSRSGMVWMASSGLRRVPSWLRREQSVIMDGMVGLVVKIDFIPESDSLQVQTLLVAVGHHQLPEVGLPLDLEAKERRYIVCCCVRVLLLLLIVVVVILLRKTSYLTVSPPGSWTWSVMLSSPPSPPSPELGWDWDWMFRSFLLSVSMVGMVLSSVRLCNNVFNLE